MTAAEKAASPEAVQILTRVTAVASKQIPGVETAAADPAPQDSKLKIRLGDCSGASPPVAVSV